MAEENTGEMIISYETLYELFRREKSRDEIQKLPSDFLNDVTEYVSSIKQQLSNQSRDVSSFSGDDIRKLQNKLESLRKVINDLYEKRERKIINMALTKSRTNAELVDVANLLSEEKEFFNMLVDTLNYYRGSIASKISARSSSTTTLEKPKIKFSENQNTQKDPKLDKSSESVPQKVAEPEENKNIMIRFIQPVPKFMDKDMNVLGPFDVDEMASLSSEIAKLLISKGKAELVDGQT